jgi:EmrB/QacA subfamily drug resistance transporter
MCSVLAMTKLSQLRRGDASPGLVLLVVCAGVVLASLDLFIVNVALPDMAADFGNPDLADLSWVLNAYAIAYAALLLPLGRLAERHRRDLGFLLGLTVFTAASAACALSDSLVMLVAFRILQAAGAALLTPTSRGPAERPGAVRVWTAVGGLAAALGPIAGGLLVALSWRWVFLVNVPIGLVALAAGWRRLPAVSGHPVPSPDALGAALATLGVAALALGLVKGEDWGWTAAATVATLAAAVVLLALFVAHTRRARNPLVDPGLFRGATFRWATFAMFLFSMAFGGMLLSLVLWMQEAWGWSALRTGLAIAPGPLMVPLFGLLVAGRLIPRVGPGPVAAVGATVFGLGFVWWALAITVAPDYVAGLLGGMVVTGIGVGLTLPTLMAAAAGSLPPQSFSTGSAVVNTVRQVGLAIGVAVLVALLGTAPDLDAFRLAWWVFAGLSFGAALTAAAPLLRPRGAPEAAATTGGAP